MQASKMLKRVCPTVVVILGATGTGKSKLALDISRQINSEIISADSMQVYKGLDIITNKVTPEELQACPHHVIDYVNPLSRYTVVDFRDKAVPIIDKLLNDDKVPIIVGGTNYYIEALLWKVLVDPMKSTSEGLLIDRIGNEKNVIRIRKRTQRDNDFAPSAKHQHLDENVPSYCNSLEQEGLSLEKSSEEEKNPANLRIETEHLSTSSACSENDNLTVKNLDDDLSAAGNGDALNEDMKVNVDQLSSEELHSILKDYDPVMANKLHPRNRRKIIRSLEVLEDYQTPHSEILANQQSAEGGGPLGGPLRYSNVCIFWVQSNQTVLDERLDKRVDSMLERGLLKELSDFHLEYNQRRLQDSSLKEELYSQGIFQSIGFKEFHDYLILSDEEREAEKGRKLRMQGVEKLKQVTRRYARKQLRWINNRFLQRPGSNVPAIYGLDGSNPLNWNEMVLEPAMAILKEFIQGKVPTVEPLVAEKRSEVGTNDTFVCDICNKRVIVGQQQWQAHLKCKSHLKRASKLRKKELMAKYIASTTANTKKASTSEEASQNVSCTEKASEKLENSVDDGEKLNTVEASEKVSSTFELSEKL